MRIRLGRESDLARCRQIERAAGEAFRSWGMAAVADDDPPAHEELTRFVTAAGIWVAVAPERAELSAYLLAEPVDGRTHIEQVSVHPDYARQGIGARLIDRAAIDGGGRRLTLTTFVDVPWNAPYYERLGFRGMTERELTPGLRKIREHERDLGLDHWPRVCMRRDS